MTYRIAHNPDGTLHGFGPAEFYEPAGVDLILTLSDTPPVIPTPIPTSVTMRQARLALLSAGLLDLVDESISLMPDPMQRRQAQIDWEFAASVDRNSALVNGLAGALALSEEALDQLFLTASQL